MRISCDTETTGIDLFHGCSPFFVTICVEDQDPVYWQWRVDPLTRRVKVIKEDLREIEGYFARATEIIFQNGKFDVSGLIEVGLNWLEEWWDKVNDTLYSGHILASGEPHDLTTMVLRYLDVDISPVEDAIDRVVKQCRNLVRHNPMFKDWLIARETEKDEEGEEENNPETPSTKSKLHKWDMWLPFEIAEAQGLPPDHEFRTALPTYGNTDSAVTLPLFARHEELLKARGLWELYLERRKLVRVIQEMESGGVTYNEKVLDGLSERFVAESTESNAICLNLGELEKLPKNGTTNAMRELLFDKWKLEPFEFSKKTGVGKVNKAALEKWELELSPKTKQYVFIKHLSRKRKADTAVSYIRSYKRFGVRTEHDDYKLLHAHLNATGSNTLRFTHSNPNEANISKQGYANLREGFGPPPGYEWWSCDYENIELRIPAYESGEEEMIDLFERPNDPPYFGSQHLLIAHLLHPREFEQCLKEGVGFKDRYKSTLYQWVKNGDFAVTYGAIEESGTADRAYHLPGAQARIKARFRKIEELNQAQIAFARQYGYVLTVPDKECGAYPVQCTRDGYGRIKPTVPLNYHTQSTAMWAMCRAMVRCSEYLRKLPFKARIVMQIHDELVFEFPARPPVNGGKPGNYKPIMHLKALMEQSGDDIGIPLKAKMEYHPVCWAKGLAV